MKRRAKILSGLAAFILLYAAAFIWYFDVLAPYIYSEAVESDEDILLTGSDTLVIRDAYYLQRGSITLRDRARLVIEDSLFNHQQPHTWGSRLEAEDESQVIIRNSVLKSAGWIPWEFRDNSTLVMEDTSNMFSAVWVSCGDASRCVVRNLSKFEGTVYGSAHLGVHGTSPIFVELSLSPGAAMDEALPSSIDAYRFPNAGDSGVGFTLEIRDAGRVRWGLSLHPNTRAVIRDTRKLSIGIKVEEPYRGMRVELSDLRKKLYEDETWVVGNTSLRLVNTWAENWYPTAGDGNVLVVRNSDLADNALSSGNARIIYENVTIGFVRGGDRVEFTIKDSFIRSDVVAEDHSVITLINTKVRGKLIEKDSGRIVMR